MVNACSGKTTIATGCGTPAKEEESALGLQYFGAPWYDPSIGRFLQMDPANFNEGNIHSFNKYAYANNNPYRYVDPDGDKPFFWLCLR